MIFGFNSDVRLGETVYHVQSEPRQGERVLQTQVFVGGRCIGKRSTFYSERIGEAEFLDDSLQELLKEQHRQVLDAAREGRLNEILETQPSTPRRELVLEWLNREQPYFENTVVLRLQVTEAASPVAGARITSRVSAAISAPAYAQSLTDDTGHAEMRIPLEESSVPEATILVQASYEGKSATRKFRLKSGRD